MHRIPNLAVALLAILLHLTAFALPEDNKQKLNIIADTTTYNFKTGDKVFTGHVKIDQGTTHITADKVTTKDNHQHKIKEAIAYGNPQEQAHYWTQPKSDEPVLDTHANIIKYYPIDSNVVFVEKVNAKQGNNSFKGELVLYNMGAQTIIVPPTGNARAVLVYNPEK